MKIGNLQANGILHLIEKNKSPTLVNQLKHIRLLIDKVKLLTARILNEYPSESQFLKQFIHQVIAETRSAREMVIERNFRPLHAVFDEKSLINLTQIDLPFDIKLCLSFGPKFIYPSPVNSQNICNILMELNSVIPYYFPDGTQDEAFKQTAIQTKLYKNKYNTDIEIWLMFLHHRLKSFLLNHPDVLVTKSDKGRHTVLIYKEDYHSKISKLVSNTSDYLPIPTVPPSSLEKTNNLFVSELVQLGTIKPNHRFRYMDMKTSIARFYGLIKIHKKDCPARPIVSQCNAPGFKLASLLNDILNKIFPEKGFHLKNTLDLVHQLKQIELASHDILVSFDVISMFTSIPIDLLLQIIKKREQQIAKIFKINWNLFSKMFLFVLKECAVFSYNDKHYKQRDSLAMGSPLSPILAKILMTEIMSNLFEKMTYRPKLVALYVDDSLWIMDKFMPEIVLSFLNEFHPKIRFTMEIENDCCISFLDLKVIRSSNQILTCWCKKSFASDMLLNYFSNHNNTCIMETAIAYVKNIINISSPEFFHKNKIEIQRILTNNCFPEDIILRILQEHYTLMRPVLTKNKKSGPFIPIIFRNKFTSSLKNRLYPLIPKCSITAVPNKQYKNLFSQLKDKLNLDHIPNIIVTLECSCKKYIDIRHTKYDQGIDHILKELNSIYDIKRKKCKGSKHEMSKLTFLKNPNRFSMLSKYEFLILKNKKRLCFPTASKLHHRFIKIINEL